MVQVGSLHISPELVNASCAWASDLGQLQALFDSPDTGAVLTRTSTLEGFQEDASSHTVAFASSSTTSLNSYGYSPHKLSQYLSWIESILSAAATPKSKPFIISITASQPDVTRSTIDAIQALRSKGPAFADIGIEFNTSCPNIRGSTPPGYAFTNLVPLLTVFADAWRADNSLTLGLKLPPYVHAAQFAEVLDTLRQFSTTADVDGHARNPIAYIACTNTLGNALLMITRLRYRRPLGGIAGDALHALALGNVYSFARLLEAEDSASGLKNLVIIGIGGVTSAEAAARMRKAGASIVGSATLFGKEGVRAFEIISGKH
ncbi:DHO-dh domain-containing protein [Mycena sanguinolenta]|uniref:Dihydroorotate oxidase n=1 Tax=Mycena sanguinolenta TaxID=230812 RepID=A0A8H7CR42_9AGAR|nr:DHO-dh domain-containing protein [Mycena sanguinolenta]